MISIQPVISCCYPAIIWLKSGSDSAVLKERMVPAADHVAFRIGLRIPASCIGQKCRGDVLKTNISSGILTRRAESSMTPVGI